MPSKFWDNQSPPLQHHLQQLQQHLLLQAPLPLSKARAALYHLLKVVLPHQAKKESQVRVSQSLLRTDPQGLSSAQTRDLLSLPGIFNPGEVTCQRVVLNPWLLSQRVEIRLLVQMPLKESSKVLRLDVTTLLKVLKRNSRVVRNLKMPLSARRDINSFQSQHLVMLTQQHPESSKPLQPCLCTQ